MGEIPVPTPLTRADMVAKQAEANSIKMIPIDSPKKSASHLNIRKGNQTKNVPILLEVLDF
jgi:hypothetical protein